MISIGIAIFALIAAITYIVKHQWHTKIANFVKQALTKLGESSGGRVVAPYAKWVMYACEAFFFLSFFIKADIGTGIATLCFWLLVASIIVLYAFRDYKNSFYGASIYIALQLISMFIISPYYGIIIRNVPLAMLFVIRLVAFGVVAFSARRRMKTINTDENAEFTLKSANKLIAAALFVLVALFFAVSALSTALSPQTRFNSAIKSGNIKQAVAVFAQMSDDASKKTNITKLKSVITEQTDSYINGTTDYNTAISGLEALAGVDELKTDLADALGRIEKIKVSKEAFDSATVAENNKEYITALASFANVIADDKSNYAIALDKIKQLKPQIKEIAFTQIKQSVENDDFLSAKKLIDEVLVTLPSDTELVGLKKDIDPLALLQAKMEQLVIVESTEVIVQNASMKSIYPDLAGISIKNVSDRAIVNLTVAYRGSDKTNYLMAIKTKDSDTLEAEKTVRIENLNVAPDEVYKDQSAEFSSDISVAGISACVKSATSADGTTWDNPYYQFWKADLSGYKGSRIVKRTPSATSKPSSSSSVPESSSGSSSSSSSSRRSSSSSSSSSKSNGYGYGDPKPGESLTDYMKREDPQLYKDMEKRWNSLR